MRKQNLKFCIGLLQGRTPPKMNFSLDMWGRELLCAASPFVSPIYPAHRSFCFFLPVRVSFAFPLLSLSPPLMAAGQQGKRCCPVSVLLEGDVLWRSEYLPWSLPSSFFNLVFRALCLRAPSVMCSNCKWYDRPLLIPHPVHPPMRRINNSRLHENNVSVHMLFSVLLSTHKIRRWSWVLSLCTF